MEWHVVDKNEKIPIRRPLLCYCPMWCDIGYQVAVFDGKEFSYEDQPNEMFDRNVLEWAIFLEAD